MESNATRFTPLFPPIHAYEQQKEASFKPTHDPPLLHIPLRFNSASASDSSPSTTAWSTIDLDLHAMTRYFALFSQGAGTQRERESESGPGPALPTLTPTPTPPAHAHAHARPIPKDVFACVTFVKVYANCRLRRIWFSESKLSSGAAMHTPWEFQLYAADADSD